MVRLTGYVTVAGRREYLNWTIGEKGILEGAGLSSSEITVHTDAPVVLTAPTPEIPAMESTEPTSYDGMNKTELQVLCSQRELSQTGTKAELIARLSEVEEAGEAEPATEGETDGEESNSE